MSDLSQITRFRDEVPAEIDLTVAQRRIMARISARPTAKRRPLVRRGYGLALAGGAVAATLAVGTVVIQNLPDRGEPRPAHTTTPTLGADKSPTEVARNARLAAATTPYRPRADQWIYRKTVSARTGRPRKHEEWVRVDGKQTASIEAGRVVRSGVMPMAATPGTWPRVDAGYLNALPTDPARLLSVIRKNNAAENHVVGYGDAGVFADIQALVENVQLSPRLYAALYGVLARLPEVHLDRSATDVAGRNAIGLYMTLEGYIRSEIMIDPRTYAYLGQQQLATKDHVQTGVDGAHHVRKGHLLSYDAILKWGIVDHPGQRP